MATIEIGPDGKQYLNDPEGYGMILAVGKHNCINTFNMNADRVAHFRKRAVELGRTPEQVVIVLANVDDDNGSVLADVLMPDADWDSIRSQGQVPFARGLAGREVVQKFLDFTDKQAAEKLSRRQDLAVVVVDHGVCEVF